MNYKIEDIEGIGPSYGDKLAAAGIKSTSKLLKECGSRKGRETTATSTGISGKLLLSWANMADMMRLKGIGPQYAEMLEASGVDTVKELAQRRADNLATKMVEVNKAKRIAKATPAESLVAGWIKAAQSTTPQISH